MYEKYNRYKDSGEFWLGDVPEHWSIKKFKHIFKEKKKVSNPILNSGAISFGKVVYKDDDRIPEATKASYQEVLSGEFLINPLNLNYDLISLRIALSDINVVVSSGYIVIKNIIDLDKRFFNYLLHRYDVAYMKLLGSGVRQTINFNHLSNSLLVFPPIKEQTSIASFLDKKTSQIDHAIELKEKTIALLKEHKQIVIQELVTGKVVIDNGEEVIDNGELKIDNARLIKRDEAEMKDSGVEWIGMVPKSWEIIPIRRLIDVRDGTHDTPEYLAKSENTYFMITSKDFDENEIDFSEAKNISEKDYLDIIKRSKVDKGDVLMSMIGGNIGKSVIVSSFTEYAIKNICLFKTQGDIYMSKYLMYYLQSGLLDIQRDLVSRGGAQPFISLADLRNLLFFKLPKVEQQAIVHYIEAKSSKIDNAISMQEQEIEKLKELKATLIDSAVTGKIKIVDN